MNRHGLDAAPVRRMHARSEVGKCASAVIRSRYAWLLAACMPLVALAQPCGLADPAFCETFESGPAPMQDRGRGNELSRTRFSETRYAPSLSTGDGETFWAWEAEFGLIPEEPPPCRSDVVGFLLPSRDTLVCDPTPTIASHYLMTAVGSQNYGSNAYRIRQPFDFADRTGTIVFDTDLASNFPGPHAASTARAVASLTPSNASTALKSGASATIAPTLRSRFAQPSSRWPIPCARELSTVEWHSAH